MQLLRKIYYTLSPSMRLKARKIVFFPIDVYESIINKRHKYEPPKGDIYIGSGDFLSQGKHQLKLLKSHTSINPEHSVLDVGSGIGRTAAALTSFLNTSGSYDGFDVVEKGIKWCNSKIKKDFPNFNFKYIALNNDLYNKTKGEAKNFKFPYDNDSFDQVFLFSVFTHMSVDEIANYLCEIKRVLKPNGLCLATFFIYNSENEQMIAGDANFSFPVDKKNHRLMSEKVKSANIALKENLLDSIINNSKLEKLTMIDGSWKNNITESDANDFQDIVILKA